jgi:hypothetical protein
VFSTTLSDAAASCSCMGLLLQLEVVESQWVQRESELEQERMEIRQMAITFKQVQIIIQTLPAATATSVYYPCISHVSAMEVFPSLVVVVVVSFLERGPTDRSCSQAAPH